MFPIEIPQWNIDLIYGSTNSGKSYLLGAMVEEAYRLGRRFIVFDTKVRNHAGLVALRGVKLLRIKHGCRYNWKRIIDIDQLVVIPTPRVIREIGVEGLIERYYRPALAELNRRDSNRMIFLEEVHHYNDSPRVPGKEIEFLFREGRGQKLYPVAATQSIVDFPKLLFRQAKRHFIFHHYEPNDKRYLSQMIPNFEMYNDALRPHDFIEFIPPTKVRIIPRESIVRMTKHLG